MLVKLDHFPRDRGENKTYTTQLWISLRNHLKPVPMEPPKQPSWLKITKNTTIFSHHFFGEFPNPLDSKAPARFTVVARGSWFDGSLGLFSYVHLFITLPETNSKFAPARKLAQKETSLVFQPSIFRCYSMLVSDRVTVINKIPQGKFQRPFIVGPPATHTTVLRNPTPIPESLEVWEWYGSRLWGPGVPLLGVSGGIPEFPEAANHQPAI